MSWTLNATKGADELPDKMLQGLGHPLRAVEEAGVVTVALKATDDAGDGSIASDVNATDFTSQTGTTFAVLLVNEIVSFTHKSILYSYIGPKGNSVGVGGSYVTVADDYVVQGTADHSLLTHLTDPDQHPQEVITGLLTDQATQDQNLIDHEVAADPHPQYTLETTAVAIFVGSGYGGLSQSTPVAIGTINATPIVVPFDTAKFTTPRLIVQDVGANALTVDEEGIWAFSLNLVLAFDEAQLSRRLTVQLYNLTEAVVDAALLFFIGRNQDGANVNFTVPNEFNPAKIGDSFQIRVISATNTFLNVTVEAATYDLIHQSEYKGVI